MIQASGGLCETRASRRGVSAQEPRDTAANTHSCVRWSLPSLLLPTWGCLTWTQLPTELPRRQGVGRERAQRASTSSREGLVRNKSLEGIQGGGKSADLQTRSETAKQRQSVDCEVIALVKGGGNGHRAQEDLSGQQWDLPRGDPDLPFSGPGRAPGSPQISWGSVPLLYGTPFPTSGTHRPVRGKDERPVPGTASWDHFWAERGLSQTEAESERAWV